MKSRSQRKSATNKCDKSKVDVSVPAIASRAINKRPNRPETHIDMPAADKPLGSNPSLSSFISAEGVAGRLLMYSQQLMDVQSDTTRCVLCINWGYQLGMLNDRAMVIFEARLPKT